ncbi:MAG: peptidase S8 [Candidatus Aminicenantes bacterium]|nr:peptidase S8 [Candidatus Aminicenantes bacterium]
MKGKKFIFAIILVPFFLFSCQSSRDSSFNQKNFILISQGNTYSPRGMQYVSDQVLVKFKSSVTEEMREAAIASYQSTTLKIISSINVYQLQVPEDVSVEEMLYLLEQNPDVEYAEPNYFRRLAQVTPDDPFFSDQYALYNSGGVFGPPSSPQSGTARADIKAREGWEETWGNDSVIIAILDTGADFNHPDLDGQLFSNGYDFINDDPDPIDDHGHGTIVAGIAAAETNNGEGMAGVAWNCKILPIKIVDNTGWSDVSTEIDGINWAILNGADVINLSLGGPGVSQSEQDAIRAAYNNGIVVVAAAGNDGVATYYPAAYPECMAVAATNSSDERVTFLNTATDPLPWESNSGPEIDVAAPGDWVLSLYPTSLTTPPFLPYIWASGTSLSTPHVAGLAALIRSIKPELSAEDIMDVIRYTADDVNSANYVGRDDFIGYGRINMERALVPIIISALNQHK